jgi:MFS superfamily sulfate permease-like transporter
MNAPLTKWISKADLKASFVVFLVALPLCLGIALASGAPLSSGIIAGIIGGIVVGILGGSEISVSGPAAGLTVIVAAGITKLGTFEILCVATVCAGVLQFLLGLFRFGYISNFIPASVIKGMLSAIGILIILKQIPHAVGFDSDFFGDESFLEKGGHNTLTTLLDAGSFLTPGAVVIAIFAAMTLLLWDRIPEKARLLKSVPGALVVVIGAVIINEWLLPLNNLALEATHLVEIPLTESIFKPLHLPSFLSLINEEVLMLAGTLALIGSLETLLSLDASEKIDPLKRTAKPAKELYAQGAGNIISGLLGGLPVTAVIVRSSANVASGGLHRGSAILHGLWLLLLTLFCAPYLNKIPLAALAMILIFVGYKLTTPKIFKSVFAKGYSQFLPFIITIISILATDLLTGVLIGFVFGIFFVIKSNMHKAVLMVQENEEYLVRFNKDVSFLNKPILKNTLSKIPNDSHLTIDGSRSIFIDNDILEIIEDFIVSAKTKNIRVTVKKSPLALSPYFKG